VRKVFHLGCAAAIASLSAPAWADFTFTDFSDTSQLKLNGNATTAGTGTDTVLRVTPAAGGQSGSVFSLAPITLSDAYSFSTRFTFNFNTQGGIEGADGLVFVVQTNANDVGGSGGGIGYQGLANSLGVEFDSYNNGAVDDFSGNHVGIDLAGNIDSVLQAESPFSLESGQNLTAWVDYNSATQLLQVFLNNSETRPVGPLLSYAVDLQSVLGGGNSAFVGFTSGTGAGWENHDVVNWTFVDSFRPVDVPTGVPEPSTWAMMLLGFGVVGVSARRRRGDAARKIART
jgi:Legume lectin domain/PEP-CTERM motif